MKIQYEIENPTNSLNPSTASGMINTESPAHETTIKLIIANIFGKDLLLVP